MRIAHASDTEKARKIIESKSCDILVVNLEGKDTIKTLNTIITPFLARIAYENKVAIGIDIKKLNILHPTERAKTLARWREVIAYCRKTKAKLATNVSKHESRALLISLSASTAQASNVLTQAF
jgi:RNase P/RNase MRP subunit p30